MTVLDESMTAKTELAETTQLPRKSGLMDTVADWIDARTGLRRMLHAIFQWRAPEYVQGNLLYALGGLTLISLVIQFFTGLCLSFYYDPSAQDAYNSVDYVTYQTPLGWLIRGIHHYNASAIVILVFLHTLRTFLFGAYKAPHELAWVSGVLLFIVTLGFGFTGYLLPWDQKGYWATVVGTKIAAEAPLVGKTVAALLRGGESLGQLTLTRFYVIHIAILPVLLVLLTLFHLHQHRRHGVAPAISRRDQARANRTVPYFPNWLAMDALLGLGLLALLVFLSWYNRAPLEFPADPTSLDYDPRPEWYFLFLFRMLHFTPGHLMPAFVVVVPGVVIGSMLLLPFVDTRPERRPWRRPWAMLVAFIYVAVIVIFTLLSD